MTGARKVPDDAPITFVKTRWKPLGVHAGLNKGEARNALARAVFIHRWEKSATGPSSSSGTAPAA